MSDFSQQFRPSGVLGSIGPLVFSAAHVRYQMTFQHDGMRLWSVNLHASRSGGDSRDFSNILFMESDTTASIFGIEVDDDSRNIGPSWLHANQQAFILFLRQETARDMRLLGPLQGLFSGRQYSCELRATAAYLALREVSLQAGVGFYDDDRYSFITVDPYEG